LIIQDWVRQILTNTKAEKQEKKKNTIKPDVANFGRLRNSFFFLLLSHICSCSFRYIFVMCYSQEVDFLVPLSSVERKTYVQYKLSTMKVSTKPIWFASTIISRLDYSMKPTV